jgi:hypothetical protein
VAADPDLILLADTKCCGQDAASVAKRPGWSNLTAVQDGGVVELDDDIASRWGPRIVQLLQQVGDAVQQQAAARGTPHGWKAPSWRPSDRARRPRAPGVGCCAGRSSGSACCSCPC